MRMPISVKVDLEQRLGYVYYAKEPKVAETIDAWQGGRVAVDVDDCGDVVGIEVLALDHETLEHAKAYAAEHGLAFPVDLAGTLAAE